MDCPVDLHLDAGGGTTVAAPAGGAGSLPATSLALLRRVCRDTARVLKRWDANLLDALSGRRLPLLVCDGLRDPVAVTPRAILLEARLLTVDSTERAERVGFLVGLLQRALFQWGHGEWHVTRVTYHHLEFLAAHPALHAAAIAQWRAYRRRPGRGPWLTVLTHLAEVRAVVRFWTWVGQASAARRIWQAPGAAARRRQLRRALETFALEVSTEAGTAELVRRGRFLVDEDRCLWVVYTWDRHAYQVVRLGPSGRLDALASPDAGFSFHYGPVRTDILYDHDRYLEPWLTRLRRTQRDPTLASLATNLLSADLDTVQAAAEALALRARRRREGPEALRLLYTALYYWEHPDKGLCRALALRVNKLVEDILTERPAGFPPSRVNRSVLRGEAVSVTVRIARPRHIPADQVAVRLRWSVNGRSKKPRSLSRDAAEGRGSTQVFRVTLPLRRGWIHYAVQVSLDGGASWRFEEVDPQSQGLLKIVADERGQRVLSCYADTFNLRLNSDHSPARDARGAYVVGDFDALAAQLAAIRAEGYTRLYPLGALELGWPGEAGPDPSVFSIWDGTSVRRDLGGLAGLLRLRREADRLGMKVILCVMSHFARANVEHPYHLPVYIPDEQGRLRRRAGWDGDWDEWRDSFMVNMRDLDNIRLLAAMAAELTTLGFGLRIDVGHGFDTVFPTSPACSGRARLFGEVCTPGFLPADLRGTRQANVALLALAYASEKVSPEIPVIYAEQWHGNDARMIQAGATPYNALIKNLEHIRSGAGVTDHLGLNDNLRYLGEVLDTYGGQSLSLFNSHDEEAPASNYQNMIWPAAAFLVFSSRGPLAYHISRLPGPEVGSFSQRFDAAYLECWKHWVNNRFAHPWAGEAAAREGVLARYPLLRGFGPYLRGLFAFAEAHPALIRGRLTAVCTSSPRVAAFVRCLGESTLLCVFNFPEADPGGPRAVPRPFTVQLRHTDTRRPLEAIVPERFYEVTERYNNVEGRQRRGHREIWSGHALLHLGFGGVLAPVSSHVYRIAGRRDTPSEAEVLPDALLRYGRYGRAVRVEHSLAARLFREACAGRRGGFRRFFHLFHTAAGWIERRHRLGVGDLATLLAEVTDGDPEARERLLTYLLRIAAHHDRQAAGAVRAAAADVLQSLAIGTVVLVSPESRFSGASGGVGIYTTDIADVLSEMGFHVVVVTPLYEANRQAILQQFGPRYEGHHWTLRFPAYDAVHGSVGEEPDAEVVNILRARLNRMAHGKRARVEVLYLENAAYFDRPYGGTSAEDKLRRARLLSQGALEALRAYNVYPSIVQTNEWPTWLLGAYLQRQATYRDDPHFARTHVLSMMHNPHPSYSITLREHDPRRACYLARVLDFDPAGDFDLIFRSDTDLAYEIDLTQLMLRTSPTIGTVSRAMRQRILDEPWVFGNAALFQTRAAEGRFFSRRNGFNMAARQRFWFGSRRSLLETADHGVQRRLFLRYTAIKAKAKTQLQADPHIGLAPDDADRPYTVFGMLHRICRQKGFELLVDWKVRAGGGAVCAPEEMGGGTILEHFLASDPGVQFVICGRVEDSPDGRRFHLHLERIAGSPRFRGRFAYYPQGDLPASLYRALYLGCQFFVMPSGGEVGEPCGISQQEAHAGGTPVIAHHQDGLKTTVCDPDFGDSGPLANGIKFQGFSGPSLLAALADAVSIHRHGYRRLYHERDGGPRRLAYADLSFNALRTDHRWLRLLPDYVRMYAHILGVSAPPYLEAAQLFVAIQRQGTRPASEAVLRGGFTVAEAEGHLRTALRCPLSSVRRAAKQALDRLRRDSVRGGRPGPGRSCPDRLGDV